MDHGRSLNNTPPQNSLFVKCEFSLIINSHVLDRYGVIIYCSLLKMLIFGSRLWIFLDYSIISYNMESLLQISSFSKIFANDCSHHALFIFFLFFILFTPLITGYYQEYCQQQAVKIFYMYWRYLENDSELICLISRSF